MARKMTLHQLLTHTRHTLLLYRTKMTNFKKTWMRLLVTITISRTHLQWCNQSAIIAQSQSRIQDIRVNPYSSLIWSWNKETSLSKTIDILHIIYNWRSNSLSSEPRIAISQLVIDGCEQVSHKFDFAKWQSEVHEKKLLLH